MKKQIVTTALLLMALLLGPGLSQARNYNAYTGRFQTMDTYEGSPQDPPSLHKYVYCHADPVNNGDPSGNDSLTTLMTGFGVRAVLARMVVGAVIGAGDAVFRGYDVKEGAVNGAIGGAVGPLIPMRIGIGLVIYGVGEALYHNDYDSALYRAATFGFAYILQTKGFPSFQAFKDAFGKASGNRSWHHIVEQNPTNLAKFTPQQIHTPNNLVPLPEGAGSIHAKISGFYNSKQPRITGPGYSRVRDWISEKSFAEQYQFGLETLSRFGGGNGPVNFFGGSGATSWTWPAVLESFGEGDDFGQDGTGN